MSLPSHRTSTTKLSSRAKRGTFEATGKVPRCARDDTGPSSSMTHAEIGVDDRLVALDRGRHAVADLLAVVEDHDPVGDVHDHAHVVLDQADRGAELVVHVQHEAAHVLLLL